MKPIDQRPTADRTLPRRVPRGWCAGRDDRHRRPACADRAGSALIDPQSSAASTRRAHAVIAEQLLLDDSKPGDGS